MIGQPIRTPVIEIDLDYLTNVSVYRDEVVVIRKTSDGDIEAEISFYPDELDELLKQVQLARKELSKIKRAKSKSKK